MLVIRVFLLGCFVTFFSFNAFASGNLKDVGELEDNSLQLTCTFPFLIAGEKNRLMSPQEYEFFLKEFVFSQVEDESKALPESDRLIKEDVITSLRNSCKELAKATKKLELQNVSKMFETDLEDNELLLKDVEFLNSHLNSAEAIVLIYDSLVSLLDNYQFMSDRMLSVDPENKCKSWWETIIKSCEELCSVLVEMDGIDIV